MLKKSRRLGAAEVKEVLKRGRSVRVGPYSAKLLASPAPLRLAVIIPRKSAPKAVTRNKLRRAAYLKLEMLPLPERGSLAVFVRPAAADRPPPGVALRASRARP